MEQICDALSCIGSDCKKVVDASLCEVCVFKEPIGARKKHLATSKFSGVSLDLDTILEDLEGEIESKFKF